MNNLLKVLQAIYENLPIIFAIIAVIIGIYFHVKRFMRLTAEQKKALLQEQADAVVDLIKQQLLSLVTKAEKEWGGGTGKVKKSWVWEQLASQFSLLMEYIESGLIDRAVIDALIEEAVAELQHLRETNEAVAASVGDIVITAEQTDQKGESENDRT